MNIVSYGERVGVEVTHACGHTAVRTVEDFNPRIKKFEPIRDVRHLDPPLIIQRSIEQRIADATPKTVEFWQSKLCHPCYQESKQGAHAHA